MLTLKRVVSIGSGREYMTLSSALDEDCGMCMMRASGYCTAPGTRQQALE